MASVIARAYVNCIKRGIRKIEDVRPDELKKEVSNLLVAEGLFDLAGVENPGKDHGEPKELAEAETEKKSEPKSEAGEN